MWEHAIEMPTTQQWSELDGHPPVRADFYWKRHRLVGEADGRVKYDGAENRDSLYRERLRQEWLEDAGFVVVRWRWEHITGDGMAMIRRVEAAIARAERLRAA